MWSKHLLVCGRTAVLLLLLLLDCGKARKGRASLFLSSSFFSFSFLVAWAESKKSGGAAVASKLVCASRTSTTPNCFIISTVNKFPLPPRRPLRVL